MVDGRKSLAGKLLRRFPGAFGTDFCTGNRIFLHPCKKKCSAWRAVRRKPAENGHRSRRRSEGHTRIELTQIFNQDFLRHFSQA